LVFINSGKGEAALGQLYGRRPEIVRQQQARYSGLIEKFRSVYPGESEMELFSSPGRTEVGGNHTDHNAGRVLAAAVDLDILAAVSKTGDGLITLNSEGYPPLVIDTRQLDPVEQERFTSAALGRGICAGFTKAGGTLGGFKACLTSSIPKGSGLSSSAGFEMLVAVILNELYNGGRFSPVNMAQFGQQAEDRFFGKPSGLMDQTTIAVGGFVTIDFKDLAAPLVRKVKYDFASSGYALVIVETGGNHADLTDEYAAAANEMKAVAQALGGKLLRDVTREKLLANLAAVRKQVSDRAILRALHYFADDQRVVDEVQALEEGRFQRFLDLVNESGRSSWMLLQNCYSASDPVHQGVPLALALTELKLRTRGAWRVHGGGFAGTIQVFLPTDQVTEYVAALEAVFGKGACHPVLVRPAGAVMLRR
jgi:galactokinase